jgi:hypothetical protein
MTEHVAVSEVAAPIEGASELNSELEAQRRKVDADNFDVTVRELVRMVSENELDRAPEYQRQFRWNEAQESKLVESILLGLPVPTIFVATNKNGTWEVIDGLQRVSTLVHYVADPPDSVGSVGKREALRLQDLDKLPAFNELTFADLPAPIQLAFLKRPLRVTALSDKSDVDVRFDMFERLNTGGIALTAQEVRACIFRGKFAEFLTTLASEPNFNTIIKLKEGSENDGTREELVLKFFAYLEGRDHFEGKVKNFLNDYMKHVPANYDYASRTSLFRRVVAELARILHGPILRRDVGWSPINLAEAVLVGAADLVQNGVTTFNPKGDWLNDRLLTKQSSAGSNTRKYLKGRIDRANELLSGSVPETE